MKKLFFQGHEVSYGGAAPPAATGWTRNPDWLALPTLLVTDQKFVGLFRVGNYEANHVAVKANGSAGYTVDWGDGVVENITSGTQANHNYVYANVGGEFSFFGATSRQAIVTITPQGAGTLTSVNLHLVPAAISYASTPNVPWLDLAVNGPNITSLSFGANSNTVTMFHLEKATLGTLGLTDGSYLFRNARNLREVIMSQESLSKVTTCSTMFGGCISIEEIPDLYTPNNLSLYCTFQDCAKLKSLPALNTAKVVEWGYMCQGCHILKEIPLLDFSAALYLSYTFAECRVITEVPALQLPKVTTMGNTFSGCKSVRKVGLIYMPLVTYCPSTFSFCTNLVDLAAIDISLANNAGSMFQGCESLEVVPAFNLYLCASATSMFSGCVSLVKFKPYNLRYTLYLNHTKLSAAALEFMFSNLLAAVGYQSLTINYTTGMMTTPFSSRSVTPTVGSNVISATNTSGIVVGMEASGPGTAVSTPIAVTFTDAGDVVTLANHGLSDGDAVSFATIVATTGLLANTVYFLKLIGVNSFQLAATLGGASMPLTNNGSGTMRYNSIVVSVVPNVSVTMSRPCTGNAYTTLMFRTTKVSIALMKGWNL